MSREDDDGAIGWNRQKVRDVDTWRQVRRAWEAGETAQSCARRFDVGLDNLWRRRAKENWSRKHPQAPSPEPPEGWDRRARDLMTAFETRLEEVRELAVHLADTLAGKPIEDVCAWHVGFLYHQRAARLGPEVAAEDREKVRVRGEPWFDDFWDADGRLRPLAVMDRAMMRHFRDDWREAQGLPDGVAAGAP